MDLKIKKIVELMGARQSMDAPHANIDWFYYRRLPYLVPHDLSKEQLLFLIHELNQENTELTKRVSELETSINDIKGVLQEYKDYFCELQVI